jgi:hypothetical protein
MACGGLRKTVDIPPSDQHASPKVCELKRSRSSDPRASARNNKNFVFE